MSEAGGPGGGDRPVFPGGIAVSRIRVYDTPAPDGLVGGSAHVHLACTEGYLVLSGRGAVQTLSGDGYGEVALEPDRLVWFTPGTIHRLVSDDRLEIVVLMQNGRLPEAGDAVLTFPFDALGDAAAYRAAAVLPPGAGEQGDAAMRRRDLAVEGFTELRRRVEADGPGALAEFYQRALALVADRLDDWAGIYQRGPKRAADDTAAHLAALRAGSIEHLLGSRVTWLPGPDEQRWGLCGHLDPWALDV